jgi:hypothetical protein
MGVRFKAGAIMQTRRIDEFGSGAELPRTDSQSARQKENRPKLNRALQMENAFQGGRHGRRPADVDESARDRRWAGRRYSSDARAAS